MTNSSKVGKIHHAIKFGEPSNFQKGPWLFPMANGSVNVITRGLAPFLLSQDLQSYSRALDACSGARRWEEALGLVQDAVWAAMWRVGAWGAKQFDML